MLSKLEDRITHTLRGGGAVELVVVAPLVPLVLMAEVVEEVEAVDPWRPARYSFGEGMLSAMMNDN